MTSPIDIAAARALCEGAVALTCATRDDNTEHKLALARIDRLRAIEAFLPAALDEIERLRGLNGAWAETANEHLHELDRARGDVTRLTADFAAMTAARDEACEIAESYQHVAANGLCGQCSLAIAVGTVEEIDALRAVGSVTK